MSELLKAWYTLAFLGLVTFVFTAFVGRAPTALSAAIVLPQQIPFQIGVQTRSTLAAMVDRRDLRRENALLEDAVAEASETIRRLDVERARLAMLLRVRTEQTPGAAAVVPVVGGGGVGSLGTLTLGGGARDGIVVSMPVTEPAGLVGLVTDVTDRRAVVRTILDPASRVGVTVRGKGGRGVAVGDVGGRVRVVRFVSDTEVTVGDVVETNSVGGLFPAAIAVGTVVEVLPPDPNDVRRSFVLVPAVDFSLLLEVAVVAPR